MNDCQKVWEECLKSLILSIDSQSFNTWFLPIKPFQVENSELTLQVPSQYFYEHIEKNFVTQLSKALTEVLGKNARLKYAVVIDNGDENSQPKTTSQQSHPKIVNNSLQPNPNENFEFDSFLNPSYVFDNFIEGNYNRMARNAGFATADRPGTNPYNPFLLYSGSGMGKTHLVHSIGNKVKQLHPSKLVQYVPSEMFISQFINSIGNKTTDDFLNHYCRLDVLIVDDIQFFAKKGETLKMFFNIFNRLYQSGKQIILTSDRPPAELDDFEDRYLSRFRSGLTADMLQPDYETKMAIIQAKLFAEGIEMPLDVQDYIAYSVDTCIRDLEGVLITLLAQSTILKKDLDLELTKQVIKNSLHTIDTDVSIDYIQKVVAEYYSVSLEELKDKTRKQEIVLPRQIAMYLAKSYTSLSLKQIGFNFGKRDHSTVIHAISCIVELIKTDKKVRNGIEEIQKRLKVKAM